MGATRGEVPHWWRCRSFNPRARDGRDYLFVQRRIETDCFNPRARDGRDIVLNITNTNQTGFNPRARDGRD